MQCPSCGKTLINNREGLCLLCHRDLLKKTAERAVRLSWDEYFLKMASVVSERSTCLRRHYGAVIVDDNNRVISTGYNGAPCGEANCSDVGYCIREKMGIPKGERYELCRAVHAEQNAIMQATPANLRTAKIYIAGTNADGSPASGKPCGICEKMIANAGIKTVIYE